MPSRHHPNRNSSIRRKRRRLRRSGYLYVAVLFTTLIIVAVVTASLTLSTANTRSQFDRINHMSAQRLAESELHRVAAMLSGNSQWRDQHTNDSFSTWISLAPQSGGIIPGVISSEESNAQVRYRLHDDDGNLIDDVHDDIVVTAQARVGQSNVAVTATLENKYPPLAILDYDVTTGNDLLIDPNGTVSTQSPVQVAGDSGIVSSTLVTPRLECSGLVSLSVRGDTAASNVSLPPQDVVDTYALTATAIPSSSLPLVSGSYQMQDIVLSATDNPFGSADAAGVYKINTQGSNLRILHCRLDATLVLENCPLVEINGGITWNFPDQADAILVTDGSIRFDNMDPELDESARNTNFNPLSSPYRDTSANTNTTDTFPTELRGIIYAEVDIEIFPLTDSSRFKVTGAVICQDLSVQGNVSISHLNELTHSPPLAFSDWVPLRFVQGSFRRIATP